MDICAFALTSRLRRLLAASLFLLVAAPTVLFATDYYVSPSGNDTHSGTSPGEAFATIQKAASIMTAGDTCHIREGVYRETVTPVNSGTSGAPIRFVRYQDEVVEVTGLDILSPGGWSLHSGAIYQIGSGTEITDVFVDGKRVPKARYPQESSNIYELSGMLDISMVTNAGVPGGQFYGMNFPSGYWNGATVIGVCGSKWVASCARIVTSGGDAYTATLQSGAWGTTTIGGNGKGFITDSLHALYTANQWHYESGTLYLRTAASSNPSASLVEARVRNHAFDLEGKNFIEIEGLHFRAARLNLRDAQYCVIADSTARFVAPYQYFRAGFNRNPGSNPDHWEYKGIEISGSNNRVTGCYIAGSWGDGLSIWGSYNTVENSLIENTNWAHVDSACISVTGTGHVIRNNTLRTSGRGILIHRQLKEGLITLNDLSQSGRGWLTDHGITYDFANDGEGTEISHNWVHEGDVGIYLDGSCANYLVHHNLVWNCGPGILCNSPSINTEVINNTLVNLFTSISVHTATSVNFTNINNLTRRSADLGQTVSNNIAYGTDSPFLDEKNFDFRLSPGVGAVDAGAVVPDITDGYAGAAPDVGAYESGAAYWVPGSSLTSPGFPDLAPANPARLRVTPSGLNQNRLLWADLADNETGYHVYRREPGVEAPTRITTLGADATAFLDTTAESGVLYEYRVSACNGAGESAGTSRVTVRTLSDRGPSLLAYDADGYYRIVVNGSIAGSCDSNDWIMFSNVDLRGGFGALRARFSAPTGGRSVEIRTGSNTGPLLGTLTTASTGSWTIFEEQVALLTRPTSGIEDVYFVFKGGSGVGNFNWFQFEDAFAGSAWSRTIEFESAKAVSGVSGDARGYTSCDDNDWICIPYVNLGIEATRLSILLSVAPGSAGKSIDIHMDSPSGPLIGTLTTASTGDWSAYRHQPVNLAGASGVRDLYFVFRSGASVANVDSFDLDLISPPAGDAFERIEAESFTASHGVVIGTSGTFIGSLDTNDWVRYDAVDFGIAGSNIAFKMGTPNAKAGRLIEARIDSLTGPIIGTLQPMGTGNFNLHRIQNMALSSVSGIHDLYLVCRGGSGVGDIDYLEVGMQAGYPFDAVEPDVESGTTINVDLLTSLDHNNWVVYQDVWLGAGVEKIGFELAVDPGSAGQSIEIRLEGPTGTLLGTLTTASTGGWSTFAQQDAAIIPTSGLRTLCLVFKGSSDVALLRKLVIE